tara:strand:+ start:986 stop:1237 length:252 start_codon:yes stop_codon:yes gene_type:complete
MPRYFAAGGGKLQNRTNTCGGVKKAGTGTGIGSFATVFGRQSVNRRGTSTASGSADGCVPSYPISQTIQTQSTPGPNPRAAHH